MCCGLWPVSPRVRYDQDLAQTAMARIKPLKLIKPSRPGDQANAINPPI